MKAEEEEERTHKSNKFLPDEEHVVGDDDDDDDDSNDVSQSKYCTRLPIKCSQDKVCFIRTMDKIQLVCILGTAKYLLLDHCFYCTFLNYMGCHKI